MTREVYEQIASILKDSRQMQEFSVLLSTAEHPTNQQSIIRNLVCMIDAMADSYSDPRNQESVDFAIRVRDMHLYFPIV